MPKAPNGPQALEPHVFIYSALGAPNRARRGTIEGSSPMAPLLPICVWRLPPRYGQFGSVSLFPDTSNTRQSQSIHNASLARPNVA